MSTKTRDEMVTELLVLAAKSPDPTIAPGFVRLVKDAPDHVVEEIYYMIFGG